MNFVSETWLGRFRRRVAWSPTPISILTPYELSLSLLLVLADCSDNHHAHIVSFQMAQSMLKLRLATDR